MLYFLVTSSLYNDCLIRQQQYKHGISKLREVITQLQIEDYKLIIIENNEITDTCLDSFECDILYTHNNVFLYTNNKGYKELQDILDCIEHFSIQDTDFIVKVTGRYILHNDSEFMSIIQHLRDTPYDCVLRYGPYYAPVDYKTTDCITGLIGMTCHYIKQIQKPEEHECVEWKWAAVANTIPEEKVCIVRQLGVDICPGGNEYFPV